MLLCAFQSQAFRVFGSNSYRGIGIELYRPNEVRKHVGTCQARLAPVENPIPLRSTTVQESKSGQFSPCTSILRRPSAIRLNPATTVDRHPSSVGSQRSARTNISRRHRGTAPRPRSAWRSASRARSNARRSIASSECIVSRMYTYSARASLTSDLCRQDRDFSTIAAVAS